MVQPINTAVTNTESKVPPTPAASGQWENEGGAAPESAPGFAKPSPAIQPPTSEQLVIENAETKAGGSVLDARQEDIMAANSSDGRPPSRWVRILEWRWFTVSAIGMILLMATWMIINGFSSQAVLQGLPYGILLLLLGASPVFISGLMRAKEERAARAIARESLKADGSH